MRRSGFTKYPSGLALKGKRTVVRGDAEDNCHAPPHLALEGWWMWLRESLHKVHPQAD